MANQDIVVIDEKPNEGIYGTWNLNNLQQAMQNLTGESLKFWLYLSKNQSNFEFGLSQKDCENWGLTKDSYYRAKKKLIDEGYLVLEGDQKFHFKMEPQNKSSFENLISQF